MQEAAEVGALRESLIWPSALVTSGLRDLHLWMMTAIPPPTSVSGRDAPIHGDHVVLGYSHTDSNSFVSPSSLRSFAVIPNNFDLHSKN